MGGHFDGYRIHFQDPNFQSRHVSRDPENRHSRLPLHMACFKPRSDEDEDYYKASVLPLS